MSFLVDEEIKELIDRGLLVGNRARAAEWQGPNDWVQPASLDFALGDVFLPETPEGRGLGGAPITSGYMLPPGGTLIVQTADRVIMPSDHAGITFAPARLAGRGILMTDAGHVDPGYSGHLTYTLINMTQEPQELRRDDPLCTMVVYRLDRPPVMPWDLRNPTSGPNGKSEAAREAHVIRLRLERLSRDFLDVTQRIEAAVKKAVPRWQLYGAILGAVATVLLTIVLNFYQTAQVRSSLEDRIERRLAEGALHFGEGQQASATTAALNTLRAQIDGLQTSLATASANQSGLTAANLDLQRRVDSAESQLSQLEKRP